MSSPRIEPGLDDFLYQLEVRTGNINNKIEYSERLWTKLCSSLSRDEVKEIETARRFAENLEYVHPGLESKEYFIHPIRVSSLGGLFSVNGKVSIAIAGLLHNVYEVGVVEPQTIIDKFGPDVDFALHTLKVDRGRQLNYEYLSNYYNKISQLKNGIGIVKVVDKIDNLYTINLTASHTTRLNYLAEIEGFVVPLCETVSPCLTPVLLDIIQQVA
jgi:(p)ppGpp synthase/HD superfamily hydrolase